MNSGIYKIIHVKTGRFYVGSTVDFKRRKRDHWRELTKGTHPNLKLQRSWDIHGEEAFIFEVVVTCEAKDLLAVEQTYLDEGNWYYNLSALAYCVEHTPQVRAKLSRAGRQRFRIYNGKSIRDLVTESGTVSYSLAINRLRRGWPIERAVSEPPHAKHHKTGLRKYSLNGVMMSVTELAKLAGVYKATMYKYLKRMTAEEALIHAAKVKAK